MVYPKASEGGQNCRARSQPESRRAGLCRFTYLRYADILLASGAPVPEEEPAIEDKIVEISVSRQESQERQWLRKLRAMAKPLERVFVLIWRHLRN